MLQSRCNGQHEHERLEGSSRTKQAESYPIPLVRAILNKTHQTKRMKMDANMAKDPLHTQIPEMFWQCENNIKVSCTRKSMSRLMSILPLTSLGIPWWYGGPLIARQE